MSLKFGKLVLLSQNNEQKEQVLKPTGNSFKFGYYMFCDYIHEHPKAKGIHCEINCDAFGRVIIFNYCKEHPINLNGRAVRNKRHLLNGSTIEILDKKFKWFYSTKKSKIRDATDVTPKQKVQIRQMPFSEPSRKKNRGDTYYSFTIQTRKEQFEESDSVMDIEQQFKENDEIHPNDRDSFKENISNSMKNITAKVCFADENMTPAKKNISCYRSETVFTSYSPKLKDSRLSRSFSFVTPIKGSPKSQYATPKSVLSEKNENLSKSFDLIEFSTPCNKLEKRSMHLIDLTSSGTLKTQRTGSPLLKSVLKNSAKSNKRLPQKFTTTREENNSNKPLAVKSALKNKSLKNSKLITTPKKVQLFPDKVDNNSTLEKSVNISPYIEEITINSTKDSTIDVEQCSSTYIGSVIEISEDDSSKNLPNSDKLSISTSTKSFSNSVKLANKITPKNKQQSVSEIVNRKSVQRSLSRSALACKTSNSIQKDKVTKLNTASLAIRKRSKSVSFEPKVMSSASVASKEVKKLTTSTPITRRSISFRKCFDNKAGIITPKRHSCCNSNTEISTKKGSAFTAKKTPMPLKKENSIVENTEDVLNTTFSIECPTPGLHKIPNRSFKTDEKVENKANDPLELNRSEKRKSLKVSAIEKTSFSLMSKNESQTIQEESSSVSNSEECENTPRKISSDIGVIKKLFNTPIKTPNKSSTVAGTNDKSVKSTGVLNKTSTSKEDNLKGIKQLLKTPKYPMKDNFVGVRELMSTPKDRNNLNLSGVRELLNSPTGNINSVVEEVDIRNSLDESVKESLSTSKWKNEDNFGNINEEVKSRAEGNLSYLKGVKEMLNTPGSDVSPKLIGKKLFTNQNPLNDSLDGIQDIFKTPSAKMLMMIGTPKSVNVNTNTSSVELQPALFDPKENMEEMEEIFKTPVSNLLECTEHKRNDCELSAEESFDKLVGRRNIEYSYTRKTISPKKSTMKYFEFEDNSRLPKTDVEEWVENVNKSLEIKGCKQTDEVSESFRKNETFGIHEESQKTADASELSGALFYSDDENSDFEKSKADNSSIKGSDTKAIEIVDFSKSNGNNILKPENKYFSKETEKLVTPIGRKNQTKNQSARKSISTESDKKVENKQTVKEIHQSPRPMILRARSNTPVLQYQKSRRISINKSSRNISLGNIEVETVNITPRKSQRIAANRTQKDKSLTLGEISRTEKEVSTDLSQSIGFHKSTRLSICSTPKSQVSRNIHELANKAHDFKFQDEVVSKRDISRKENENLDQFSQDSLVAKKNISATEKNKHKSSNMEFSQLNEKLQEDNMLQSIREQSTSPIIIKSSLLAAQESLEIRAFENFEEYPENQSKRMGKSISSRINIKENNTATPNKPRDEEKLKAQIEMERFFENFQENTAPKLTRTGRSISPIVKKSLRLPRKTLGSKPTIDEHLDVENLKAQLEMERAFENFQENAEPRSTRTGRSIFQVTEKKSVKLPRKTLGSKPATDEPLDVASLKTQLEMERAFENFQENAEPRSTRTRTGRSISPVVEKKSLRLPRKTVGSKPATDEPLDVENLKTQLEMEIAFENFQENAEPRSVRTARSISPVAEKKSLKLPRKTLGSKSATDEPLDVENLKTKLEMERAFENFQENAEPRSTRTGRSISPVVEKRSLRLPRKTLGSKPATDEPLDVENLKTQLEMERAFENFQENAEPRSIRTARSISPVAEKKSVKLPRKTLGSKPATDEPLDVENLKTQLEMERAFENFQENAEPRSTRTGRSISPVVEKRSLRLPRKTLGSKPATDEPLDIENLKTQLEMERAFENFQENAEPRPTRAGRSISPIVQKKSQRLPRKTLGSKPATDEPLDVENLKTQLEMERAFENFQENAVPRSIRTARSISPVAEKKSVKLPRKTLGSKPATDEPLDVENLKTQLEMERAFENFQENAEPRSTRTGRSISPIVQKKSQRLPRKTLGSKPATDEPLDVENLKTQLEMERAFENFQENAEPRSTRAGRSISPIAEKKSVKLPRKTLGSKPAIDEPLDVENLKTQFEMERAFENFQENAEPRSTRAGRSISPIAEKKSLRLARKTRGSKPATDEPLDVENLKTQLEMERAFENFQENAKPRSTRTARSISPVAEKKSLKLPRKTLGSKPATDEPLDVENLKTQLEMERAFENFQENAEPRSTRTGRSISPVVEKRSLRLPRKTLGSKPATNEPLDVASLKTQLEMERAFENFQENAEPRSTRTGRSISPVAEKKSVKLLRKTLGSKPATDEPLDIENLKTQLEMEKAFENFQENAEPRSTRTGRSISPVAEKKSVKLPRKTLGSKPATDEPLDVASLKTQLEMERAFENFQENAEPRSTRTGRSISPVVEKKSLRLPRKTLGSKPATDEPLDVENLKAQLEMERAFENFQENAEPRSTRAGRSISPIAEKKSLRLPRKTLGSKPTTDEPLDVENLKTQLEMERAFENFQENAEPRSTRTGRSISPVVEKKSLRLPRKTLGSKPATDERLDVKILKAQLEMERAFENFQENAEPRSTRAGRSTSPIAEKKSLRLPRKTLGSKPATDEPLDVENLKTQLEMERAFENFQENAEPRSTRAGRSISPVAEKKSLKLPRKTLGSKPATDELLDVETLKAQIQIAQMLERLTEHPNRRLTRGVKSLSPLTDKSPFRQPRKTLGDNPATNEPLDIQSLKTQLELKNAFDTFNEHPNPQQVKAKSIYPIVKEKREGVVRTTIGDRKSCNIQCEAELEMRAVFENFQNNHETSHKMKVEEVGIIQTICPEELEVENAIWEKSAENSETIADQENIKMLNVQADNLDQLEKEGDNTSSPSEHKSQDNPDEISAKPSPAKKGRRYAKKAGKVAKTEKTDSTDRITRTRRQRKNLGIDASLEISNQNSNEEKLQTKSEQSGENNVIESETDSLKEQTNSVEITPSIQLKTERVKRKVTFLNQSKVDPSPDIPKKSTARRGKKVTISEDLPAVVDATDKNSSNTADSTSEENTKSEQGSGKTSEAEIIQEQKPTKNHRERKRIVKNYKVEETVHDEGQNQENESLIGNQIKSFSQNRENNTSSTETKTDIQEIGLKETTSRSTRTTRRNIEKSESESEHESRSSRRNQAKKILNKKSYKIKEEPKTIETLENNSEMVEKEVSSQKQGASLAVVKKESEVTEGTEREKEVEKNHNLRKRRGNNKKTNESAEPSDNLETNDLSFAKRMTLSTSISSKEENISEVSKTIEEAKTKMPSEVNIKRTRGRRLAEGSKNIDAKGEMVCDQSSNNLHIEKKEENQNTAKERKTRTRLPRSEKIDINIEISENETPENIESSIASVSVSTDESKENNSTEKKQNVSELIKEEKQDSAVTSIKKKRGRKAKLNSNIEVEDKSQKENIRLRRKRHAVAEGEVKTEEKNGTKEENLMESKENVKETLTVECHENIQNNKQKLKSKSGERHDIHSELGQSAAESKKTAELTIDNDTADELQSTSTPIRKSKRNAGKSNKLESNESKEIKEETAFRIRTRRRKVEPVETENHQINISSSVDVLRALERSSTESKKIVELTRDNDTTDELQTSTPIRKSKRNATKSNKVESNESKEIKEEASLPKRPRRRRLESVETEKHQINNSTNNDENLDTADSSKIEQNTKNSNISLSESKVDAALEFKTPIKAAPRTARRLRSNSVTATLTPILPDEDAKNETNPSDSTLNNSATHPTSESKVIRRVTKRNKKNDESNQEELGTSRSQSEEWMPPKKLTKSRQEIESESTSKRTLRSRK